MGSCLGRSSSNKLTGSTSSASSLVSTCLGRHSTDDQDLDLISQTSGSHHRDHFIFRIWNFKRKKKSSHILERFWQHQDTTYAKLNNGSSQAECFADIQLQNLDVTNLLHSTSHTKESSINYLPSRVPSSRASSSLDLEWEHEYSQMRHYQQHLIKQRTQLLQTYQQQQQQQRLLDGSETKNYDDTSADESSWHYTHHEEDGLNSMASMSSIADNIMESMPLQRQQRSNDRMAERKTLLRSNNRLHGRGSMTRNSSHNSWSHISTPESLEWDIDEEQQQKLHMEDDSLDHDTLKLLHQIEQLKNQVLYETGEGLYDSREVRRDGMANTLMVNDNYGGRSNATARSTKFFQLDDSDGENGNYS